MVKQKVKFEKLIEILKKHSDFTTAKELSDDLKSSEKTIYRLVKEINDAYFPNELISSMKGKGFKLNRKYLSHQLTTSSYENFTPADRQLRILERLLLISPKRLLIYDLGQEFYVSDSVILKDKVEIQKKIENYNLKIKTHTGAIFVKGSEVDIRRAIADLVPTFNTIDIDDLSLSSQSDSFDHQIASFINNEIKLIEKHLQAELPYPYNINIFSHLYIMIERLKKGSHGYKTSLLEFDESEFESALLEESKRVIQDIGSYLGREIDDIEIKYLYQYLYSSRFQLNPEQQQVLFSKRVNDITTFYFNNMIITKGRDIDQQSSMFIDLANHISPMLRRLDNKIRIKNNMLPLIKENYQDLFEHMNDVSHMMIQEYGFPNINDDEIGFLTLYFARFQEIQFTPIKTLIMCSSGIGTSELLKSKIEKTFSAIDVIDVIPYRNMVNVKNRYPNTELLVTTVDLDVGEGLNKILVSALMTTEDQNRLRKKIEEINYGRHLI
jgi:activator of the mannose operon (transcriptional antiterminator)